MGNQDKVEDIDIVTHTYETFPTAFVTLDSKMVFAWYAPTMT